MNAATSTGAEPMLKSKLTLSAVVERNQLLSGALTESHPAEALVRDERDPFVWTEAELRLAWGDR